MLFRSNVHGCFQSPHFAVGAGEGTTLDCVTFLQEAEKANLVVCEKSRVVHEIVSPLEVEAAFPLLAALSPQTNIVVEMTSCLDLVVGKVQQNGDHLQLFLILRATPRGGEPF